MFLSRCELGARLPGLQALWTVYHCGAGYPHPVRFLRKIFRYKDLGSDLISGAVRKLFVFNILRNSLSAKYSKQRTCPVQGTHS
jgi:hypothetical protein